MSVKVTGSQPQAPSGDLTSGGYLPARSHLHTAGREQGQKLQSDDVGVQVRAGVLGRGSWDAPRVGGSMCGLCPRSQRLAKSGAQIHSSHRDQLSPGPRTEGTGAVSLTPQWRNRVSGTEAIVSFMGHPGT